MGVGEKREGGGGGWEERGGRGEGGWKGEGEGGWEGGGGAWGDTEEEEDGCMGVGCVVVEGSSKFTYHITHTCRATACCYETLCIRSMSSFVLEQMS